MYPLVLNPALMFNENLTIVHLFIYFFCWGDCNSKKSCNWSPIEFSFSKFIYALYLQFFVSIDIISISVWIILIFIKTNLALSLGFILLVLALFQQVLFNWWKLWFLIFWKLSRLVGWKLKYILLWGRTLPAQSPSKSVTLL